MTPEILLTTLVGWIPQSPGFGLRQRLYKPLFAHLGHPVFIRHQAEFVGMSRIYIGDRVSIQRGVRVDCKDANSSISLGNGVHLDRGVDVRTTRSHCQITIGDRTSVNPYTCIHGPGNITIGQNCLIASHVGIYASQYVFADRDRPIKEQGLTCSGIVIEDDCWLGSGVKVMDGVTIGRGSVIGAGAIVTKDIPPYSLAVGVPAKVIGQRGQNMEAGEAIARQLEKELNHRVDL